MLRPGGLVFALACVFVLACAAAGRADEAQVALGRKVFTEIAEPRCGLCHALADAGTAGEIGPALDALKPDAARVKAAVTNGLGAMPAFEDLTREQVEAVAAYVAAVTGGAK